MEPREELVDTEHLKPGPLSYGIAIGAAAVGIGLGVLLVCCGLSWLWDEIPRSAEIARETPAKLNSPSSMDRAGRKRLADRTEGGSVKRAKDVTALIRREVTEFRSIDHEAGRVTTGWQYADGRGEVPVLQHCYYTAHVPGTKYRSDSVEIAIDGKSLSDPDATSVPDLKGAEAKCQWWTKEKSGMSSDQQHANEP
jgi:hypothetical protein